MMRRFSPLFLTLLSFPFIPALAHSQGTRLWSQSRFDELEKGKPNGVAITSDGHLVAGPESRMVLTTPSTYVWSVAADREGNAYLATGTPATVLRVTPDGKSWLVGNREPFGQSESAVMKEEAAIELHREGLLFSYRR